MQSSRTLGRLGRLFGVTLLILAAGVAWALHDARQAVLEWGAGFIDQPAGPPPADAALDKTLYFALGSVGVDRPAAIATAFTDQLQWWLGPGRAEGRLGQPDPDGARPLTVWFQYVRRGETRTRRLDAWAHPVTCPEPAPRRRCAHVGLGAPGRLEIHLALVLEAEASVGRGDRATLHLDGLFLVPGSTRLGFGEGPLSGLSDLPLTEMIHLLSEHSEARPIHRPPPEPIDLNETGWAISAHGTATQRTGVYRADGPGPRRPAATFVERWRRLAGPGQAPR